ncbi:hypothetical protein K402DRAFT_433054 [Aulographum hederae CBS 113979]|uniref:Uncharacterized protein n=1 Tax=Aulographum hederae CBS 113979 TaxID=1176131 RepID=A0A6G1GVQ0_9PEZI|nr:hypothetical protein K402DRAFT_433054 [Aulographum hederae CBS 113979]
MALHRYREHALGTACDEFCERCPERFLPERRDHSFHQPPLQPLYPWDGEERYLWAGGYSCRWVPSPPPLSPTHRRPKNFSSSPPTTPPPHSRFRSREPQVPQYLPHPPQYHTQTAPPPRVYQQPSSPPPIVYNSPYPHPTIVTPSKRPAPSPHQAHLLAHRGPQFGAQSAAPWCAICSKENFHPSCWRCENVGAHDMLHFTDCGEKGVGFLHPVAEYGSGV